MLKVAVHRIFLPAPQLDFSDCLRIQQVMLVFDAVTPGGCETGLSCLATHQDMLVRNIKERFELQWYHLVNDSPLRMQIFFAMILRIIRSDELKSRIDNTNP